MAVFLNELSMHNCQYSFTFGRLSVGKSIVFTNTSPCMQDIMLKNIINMFKAIKGRQLINILDKVSERPGLQVALLTYFMKTLKMMYHSMEVYI